MRAAVFVAGLLLAPVSATAQPATPAPTTSTSLDQRKAAGLRLAQLLYPEEIQVRVGLNLLRSQFGPSILKNPAVKSLEADHPGLVEALVADLEPSFKRFIVSELPNYHRGIGDLYGSNFSVTELTEIHRFYSTPTGRKISRGVQNNMSLDSVMAEAVGNPDSPSTKGAIESDLRATVARTMKSIDGSDTAELMRFGSAPWFPKLKAFRTKLLAFETEFMNRPAPAFESEIEKIIERTIQRVIVASERKTAS